MKKSEKIIYYAATGIFTLMLMAGASMYFFMHEKAVTMWEALGFPIYLIYPLGVAKVLGLVAIWTNVSKVLKGLAYAGFFFNILLAISAHLHVGDGEFVGAILPLVLLIVSYFLGKKMEQ